MYARFLLGTCARTLSFFATPRSQLLCFARRAPFTTSRPGAMIRFEHLCSIDAEPLDRYRPGGYHPAHIGDQLDNGRYRIVNKLGWGGWSTVWLAQDQHTQDYVAIRIATSELTENLRETKILETVAAAVATSKHPGSGHVSWMTNHFRLQGPNGLHSCFVHALMGPNVPDILDRKFNDEKLPGALAKRIAKQALLGLDFLHKCGIAHGDLHTRNLVFTLSSTQALAGSNIVQGPKEANIGSVRRADGNSLETNKPTYLVQSVSCPVDLSSSSVRIIDFGEAFFWSDPPSKLHTPLVVRAPEAVFGDVLDYRVDLWSMGCMLFELISGQPPFTNLMITPANLVSEWVSLLDEKLPPRWETARNAMGKAGYGFDEMDLRLQAWLEEIYFDNDQSKDFDREDIAKVGELVKKMLRLEPSERASAEEILQDPWFQDVN